MNSLIEGRRGLGKTTLAQIVALQTNPNILGFDPNNQLRNASFRTSDLKELEGYLDDSQHIDESFFASYIPQGDVEAEWDRFAAIAWQFGDYSLIVDEAHRLQTPQYVNEWLDKFIRQAPRRERGDDLPIDIIQTFHRPIDVNGIVLSQADYAYIFRQTKKRDLEYLEKEFDIAVANAVQTLRTPETDPPGRDVIKLNVVTGEYELIDDPATWFINIRGPKKEAVGRAKTEMKLSTPSTEEVLYG